MNGTMRISVLVSGGGTNLQALIDSISGGDLPGAQIAQVISSRKGAFALERAKRAGIKTAVISKEGFPDAAALSEELLRALDAEETDLVVLAGYMSILRPEVTAKYKNRIINIHPSLIPKYCGKGFYGERVHRAVLAGGEKATGATVHFVDEGVDTGKIILQREVPVKEGDDAVTLAARVLETEHVILPEAVRLLIRRRMKQVRKFEIENAKGHEVSELRLRYKTNCECNHYSNYMYSGPQILQYAIDALTDLTVRRDNGDGSMLANVNANFRASLFGGDTIEVVIYVEKEGKRSRTYVYQIWKIIENHREQDVFEVLEEPVLVLDGTAVCVVKKPREDQIV